MGTNPLELTVEPLPQPPVPSRRAVIGALWRRFLAFLVDALLLGIIGSIVGALFFETLVRMGPWARVVGLLIALCYFGFLDSSTGSGQTVGKRFFRLKVVDSQGGMLS